MTKATKTPSKIALEAWRKLGAHYGADVIERRYGTRPDEDWSAVLGRLDREGLARTFNAMKIKHPQFPPSLWEFEQLVDCAAPAVGTRAPSTQERLSTHVLRHKRLSPMQLATPWTYLHDGSGEVIGAVVPSDGAGEFLNQGYRVMVDDLALDDVAVST